MNEIPFLSLINNAALLLAIGVIYQVFSLSSSHKSCVDKTVTGIVVGVICIALMMMPLVSAPGVLIDARSVLLSVSGLFFGFLPTLIAVLIAIAFRVVEGGQGLLAGVLVIVLSAGIGFLYRYYRYKKNAALGWWYLYLLGLCVHLVYVGCLLLLLKDAIGHMTYDIFLPILLIFPLVTVLLGKLLFHQQLRHETENALRASQLESDNARQSLQATLAALPDLLFELDIAGRYHQCHASVARDLVMPEAELIGKTIFDVLPCDAANQVMAAIEEAHASGTAHGKQIVIPMAHGEQYFELSVACKLINEGDLPRFIVLSRNITARKEAEKELHIAATAFDSQEGMMITDENYAILRVNSTFTRITGYAADDVIGKTPALLKSGRHDQAFYADMKHALAHEYYWHGEIWNRRKNGEHYPELLSITAVLDEHDKVTNYVGSFIDITQRKKSEEYIYKLAYFDVLTGLANRRSLQEYLDRALAGVRTHQRLGGLLFIDLDNFKNLNDTKGHNTGDQLLVAVAHRLEKCIGASDMVARLGGDEFIVVLDDLGKDEAAAYAAVGDVIEKIRTALLQPVLIHREHYHTSCSIGATLFASDDMAEEVTKRADMAMYQAKSAGRNTYKFFDPDKHMALFSQAALEVDLRKALSRQQLKLYYQVQCENDRVIGAEALLRWHHPEKGLIPPAAFIPLAEQTGLIKPIGGWVLHQACEQISRWQQHSDTVNLTLAVNVSAYQFSQECFVEEIAQCIESYAIPASRLKLELTESLVLVDVEDSIAKMRELKCLGVGFALDDFGTGYSSLLHLKRLPLDQLKIDRSFVQDILTDQDDDKIVQTIISMGLSLDLNVLAEGIETEQQKGALQRYGCYSHQGYLYGKPMPIERFTETYFPNMVSSTQPEKISS